MLPLAGSGGCGLWTECEQLLISIFAPRESLALTLVFLSALWGNDPVLGDFRRPGALSLPNYGVHLYSTGHLVWGAPLEVCHFKHVLVLFTVPAGSFRVEFWLLDLCVLLPVPLPTSNVSFSQAVL